MLQTRLSTPKDTPRADITTCDRCGGSGIATVTALVHQPPSRHGREVLPQNLCERCLRTTELAGTLMTYRLIGSQGPFLEVGVLALRRQEWCDKHG